jgi:hypothetical protein
MAVDFSKLLDHPDKDEIISKLITGIAPKDVNEWLKLKYAKDEEKHLHLSVKLLKDFKDGHLDLYNDLRNDIAKVESGQPLQKAIAKSLQNNKTYQERLNEYADKEVDIKKLLANMIFVGTDRIEQLFDKIQQDPLSHKADYALLKWLEGLSRLLDQWGKMVLNTPDQIIQHNVTVEKVGEYSHILQSAVRETLAEIDPDIANLFLEKLNVKLEALQSPDMQPIPLEKRLKDVQILSTKIHSLAESSTDKVYDVSK